jgi:hypothetical protein
MVNKRVWLGILVMVLVFGMTVVGCDDGSTNDNGGNTGGTFVLTDIPSAYNGKYAYFEAENSSVYIAGCQSISISTQTITLVQISNGRVSIPMWIFNEASGSVSRYSGNDTFTQDDRFGVVILEKAVFTYQEDPIASIYFSGSLVFNNGGAEKSVNNGTLIPY